MDPQIYPVNINKIPTTLKKYPQWVMWNNEPLPSKPRGNKTPKYNRIGFLGNASSTDHLTWDTFDGVSTDIDIFKPTGVGFVLTKASGIFCIDIDECVSDKRINEIGQSVLDVFDNKTYVELSYHNDGLHIFGIGNLPESERGGKRGPIEIYDSGRFIAVTGHKLSSSSHDVTDCQIELNKILGKYPKTMKAEQPQRKIVSTFTGERIQDKYGLSCVDVGYPTNAVFVGGKIVGSHPVHGSSTGSNFHINTRDNLWHCFRCESGGSALELYAVVEGIIDCGDAQPGCLNGHWRELFDSLERNGYKPDPKKFPKTIFDKRRDTEIKLKTLGVM
jgi:hypothetical protein